jgi:hypothetical protein
MLTATIPYLQHRCNCFPSAAIDQSRSGSQDNDEIVCRLVKGRARGQGRKLKGPKSPASRRGPSIQLNAALSEPNGLSRARPTLKLRQMQNSFQYLNSSPEGHLTVQILLARDAERGLSHQGCRPPRPYCTQTE